MKRCILLLTLILLTFSYSADWSTGGGNSMRNGLKNVNCPSSYEVFWSKSSLSSTLGYQSFIEGDKLVTTRYNWSNPSSYIVCHNLVTGDTIWTRNYKSDGKFLAMGLKNGIVITRDFRQNGVDSLYGINVNDGSILWASSQTVERGSTWSVGYADNGDLIVVGSSNSVRRINHLNGALVWKTTILMSKAGTEGFANSSSTIYGVQGALNQPKRLFAMDIDSGTVKYYSDALAGDPDQENPVMIAPNGNIYVQRDGGNLYAFRDNGTGFTELWNIPIPSDAPYCQFATGPDNTLYLPYGNAIARINPVNGNILNTSTQITTAVANMHRITIDQSGRIYCTNSEGVDGKVYCFTSDLQSLWSDVIPYGYYAGPAVGMNGLLAVSSSNGIKVYGNQSNLPVELTSLTAFQEGSGILLKWTTATEINNKGFEIERSLNDGSSTDWSSIAFQNGIGTTTSETNYSFKDDLRGVSSSSIKYRLKQIDFDGSYSYSEVVTVNLSAGKFELSQNYPNPFNPSTTISFSIAAAGLVNISIYNVLGEKITELANQYYESGKHTINFNASGLSSGIYIYRLQSGEFVSTKEMILLR